MPLGLSIRGEDMLSSSEGRDRDLYALRRAHGCGKHTVSRKHWSDLPACKTHFFDQEGHCKGCMMHRDWPGARESCTMPYSRPRRTPVWPWPRETIIGRFDRIELFARTKPKI